MKFIEKTTLLIQFLEKYGWECHGSEFIEHTVNEVIILIMIKQLSDRILAVLISKILKLN